MDVRFSKSYSTPWGSPWGSRWSFELPPPANSNEIAVSAPPLTPTSIHVVMGRSNSESLPKPARVRPLGRRGERKVTRVSHFAILLYIHDCGIPDRPSARGLARLAADYATKSGLADSDLLDHEGSTTREIARDSLLVLQAPKMEDSSPDNAKKPPRARPSGPAGKMQVLWLGQRAIVHYAGHLVVLRYERDCGITSCLTPANLARLAIDHASQFDIKNSDLLDPDDPDFLEIARDSLRVLGISV